jgi:hypothetical protein
MGDNGRKPIPKGGNSNKIAAFHGNTQGAAA